MNAFIRALGALCLVGCTVDAGDDPPGAGVRPTVQEGAAAICAAGRAIPCADLFGFCTLPPSFEAEIEQARCRPVAEAYFGCMVRPQRHRCDALSLGLSAACVRISEAMSACAPPPDNPNPAFVLGAVTVAGIVATPQEASLLVESDTAEARVVPIRATVRAEPGDANGVTVQFAATGAAATPCTLRLRRTDDRWFQAHEVDTTPVCTLVVDGAEHSLRITAALAYRIAYETHPKVWIEATATGPRVGTAAALMLYFGPISEDNP